ncbi:phage tail assembly chaperone [Mesorhizobium liriopis]|uniref:phage tail assembly chaperone n=1 Tax=Mesorhizobium liriopis TaxID=2953882 RepID=UPI003EBE5FB5
MSEVIRLHVRYSTPDDKGETRRQRNERFGVEEETPEPDIDPDTAYLLDWFWNLHSARAESFDGPQPLSFTDIANWSALTGTILLREELGILRQMDAAFLSAHAIEREEARERRKGNT